MKIIIRSKKLIVAAAAVIIAAAIAVPLIISNTNKDKDPSPETSYEVETDEQGNIKNLIITDSDGNKIVIPNDDSHEIETDSQGNVTGIFEVDEDGETKVFDYEETIDKLAKESTERNTTEKKTTGSQKQTAGNRETAQDKTNAPTTPESTASNNGAGVASQTSGFANVVVFVQFTNSVSDNYVAGMNGKIYQTWNDTSFPKSLTSYLNTISYGKFKVNNIFPQYNSSKNLYTSYRIPYTDSEYQLVKSVISQIKLDKSINVDSNNDGLVDNLTIIVEHEAVEDSGSMFYNHKTQYDGSEGINGKKIYYYNMINSASALDSDLSNYGVVCHEFLHTIGYPDLYYYNGNGTPVGQWDIMANATTFIPMPLAYMRYTISGWTSVGTLTATTRGVTISSAQSASGKQAYILKSPMSDTEFFVIEFRKQGARYSNELDVKIPGSGLIIYRVNTGVAGLSNAAGRDAIYVFRQGDMNQSFFSVESGRTSYGSSDQSAGSGSNALVFSDGTNSGIVIKNIGSAAGNSITCDVEFNNMAASSYWSSLAGGNVGAGAYGLCANEINGKVVVAYQTEWDGYKIGTEGTGVWGNTALSGEVGEIYDSLTWKGAQYILYTSGVSLRIGAVSGGNVTGICTVFNGYINGGAIAVAGDSLYVVYNDNISELTSVAKYNAGSAAATISSGFTKGCATGISMTASGGSLYIAYRNASGGGYTIGTWRIETANGTATALTCPGSGDNTSMTVDGGKIYLAVSSNNQGKGCTVYSLSGSSYVQLGGSLASGQIQDCDIETSGGKIYVAMTNQSTNVTSVMVYNGAWNQLGENVSSKSDAVDLVISSGRVVIAYMVNGNCMAKFW